MQPSPDWSLLLPDILCSISEKLISLTDFIRFRAVCPRWRSASSSPPLHLPAQIPWLMLPFDNKSVGNDDGSFVVSFYDPVQSKTHEFNLPEMMGQRVCGSSHGWLLLAKKREVCLFNPLTRARIPLPSLNARAGHLVYNPGSECNWHSENDYLVDYGFVEKVCLSCQPSVGPDCVVSAVFRGNWEVAFCRIGDPCWTVVHPNYEGNSDWFAYDVTYLNGLLYYVCRSGALGIVNLSTPHKNFIPAPANFPYLLTICVSLRVNFRPLLLWWMVTIMMSFITLVMFAFFGATMKRLVGLKRRIFKIKLCF